MHIEKAEIIATLRSRGLHARADWVDRQLPRLVDTYKNDSLLSTLDIDPAAMSPVEVASQQGRAHRTSRSPLFQGLRVRAGECHAAQGAQSRSTV